MLKLVALFGLFLLSAANEILVFDECKIGPGMKISRFDLFEYEMKKADSYEFVKSCDSQVTRDVPYSIIGYYDDNNFNIKSIELKLFNDYGKEMTVLNLLLNNYYYGNKVSWDVNKYYKYNNENEILLYIDDKINSKIMINNDDESIIIGVISDVSLCGVCNEKGNSIERRLLKSSKESKESKEDSKESKEKTPKPTKWTTITPKPTEKKPCPPTPIPSINTTPKPTSSWKVPTNHPTSIPTSNKPTWYSETPSEAPTLVPTSVPSKTWNSEAPTKNPTNNPTSTPTGVPSKIWYSEAPTAAPSTAPTNNPTRNPTHIPTAVPTVWLTPSPSAIPTAVPSSSPSASPTKSPSQSHWSNIK